MGCCCSTKAASEPSTVSAPLVLRRMETSHAIGMPSIEDDNESHIRASHSFHCEHCFHITKHLVSYTAGFERIKWNVTPWRCVPEREVPEIGDTRIFEAELPGVGLMKTNQTLRKYIHTEHCYEYEFLINENTLLPGIEGFIGNVRFYSDPDHPEEAFIEYTAHWDKGPGGVTDIFRAACEAAMDTLDAPIGDGVSSTPPPHIVFSQFYSKLVHKVKGWSKKGAKAPRKLTVDLCTIEHDLCPAVGGIQIDDIHLAKYPILPPYVLLFEPTDEEIWVDVQKRAQRSIFLNQPLDAWEEDELSRFRPMLMRELGFDPSKDSVPRWVLPHMTRLLQQCKYNSDQACKLASVLYRERVLKLPITYDMVRKELCQGLVYWHGRDTKCRPLMTIRIGRALRAMDDSESVQRLFLFTMEFAVRHLLVPGRVENWAVLIDCTGGESLPMKKCKEFAQAVGTTLGKVYSGRMVWLKIFNFPTGIAARALKFFIEGIVSALGKSDKVSFVSDPVAELEGKVELGQLESWAGGAAPNLPPADVFPYRMFATPEGYTEVGAESATPVSLHQHADLSFHEGQIWADCLDDQTNWRKIAKKLPLPPQPASVMQMAPVRDVENWRKCMSS